MLHQKLPADLPPLLNSVANEEEVDEAEDKLTVQLEEDTRIKKEKEVFNVAQNIFTYDEAKYACKALDAELATYEQVMEAQQKGANWCNYGWTKGQMALYPIQEEYHKNIQSDPATRNTCQSVGLNGGYFPNKKLRFGVNCYGDKTSPDATRVVYTDKCRRKPVGPTVDPDEMKIQEMKKLKLNEKVLPFNSCKWSRESEHTSSYLAPVGQEYEEEIEVEEGKIYVKSLNGDNNSKPLKNENNVSLGEVMNGNYPMTEEVYSNLHNTEVPTEERVNYKQFPLTEQDNGDYTNNDMLGEELVL